MKKKIIYLAIILLVAAGGIGWYMHHSEQVRQQKLAAYKEALKDFRYSSKQLTSATYFIMWDYSTNWRNAIKGLECLDASNRKRLYDDMDDAVSARYTFYKSFDVYQKIDSCRIALAKCYIKVKENADEKQASVIPLLDNIIKTIDESIKLSKKPGGTLASYSYKYCTLTDELKEQDEKLAKYSPDDDDKIDDIRVEREAFIEHGTGLLTGCYSNTKGWKKRSYTLTNIYIFLNLQDLY